jgi:hypothetical protein
MNKRNGHSCLDETARRTHLNAFIDKAFGHLAPDEVELLAASYQEFETRMFEVVHVRRRSSVLMDLFEDLEFKPVQFPKELTSLLKRHDVFLGTIGFKDSVWTVLHLSPCYLTDSF